ncbi:MAG: hypothetical protein ABIH25_04440 [Candidatus Woesearchaeota archaeon]
MNKRGDFTGRSAIWLLIALIFLYIALTPFGFLPFPFSLDLTESIVRGLIAVIGVLIFIESFNYDSKQKFLGIVIGLIFFLVGVYILLMSIESLPFSLPYTFEINDIFLQVILIIYALYLAYASFKQD